MMSESANDQKEILNKLEEYLDVVNKNLWRVLEKLDLDQCNELKSRFTRLSEKLQSRPSDKEIKNIVKDFPSSFARIGDVDLLETVDPTTKIRTPDGPSRAARAPKNDLPDVQHEKLIAQKVRDIAARIEKSEKKQK
jgi:hypothetical protein